MDAGFHRQVCSLMPALTQRAGPRLRLPMAFLALGTCLLAPRGGWALELGGVEIPPDRFVVFLFVGHCNMAGADPDMDTTTDPAAWNYQLEDYDHAQVVGWIPARDPVHRATRDESGAGPAMPFLKRLIERYPSGYRFGVIQNAHPHASVADDYCRGCPLYEELVAAALAVAPEVTFGGLVAMLGQNDGFEATDASQFAERFATMVEDLRVDLSAPNLPAFVGQYEDASNGTSHWEVVREEILDIPATSTLSAVNPYRVPESGYWDMWRYTREAHTTWARALVDEVIVPGTDHDWSHFWYPAASADPDSDGQNSAPIAVIGMPRAVARGESVQLDGTDSYDDGEIVTYEWDFGDGATDYGATVAHTWPTLGTYRVTLRVTDAAGTSGQTESSVDVLESVEPAISIAKPSAGDEIPVASRVSIQWDTQHLDNVEIMYSSDDGQTWSLVGYCDFGNDCWGNLEWMAPDQPSERSRILIEGYFGEAPTISDRFVIVDAGDGNGQLLGGCTQLASSLPCLTYLGLGLLLMCSRRLRERDE